MRKLIGVELAKMRHYRVVWGVAVFEAGYSASIALNGRFADRIARYPELEYIIFLFAACRMFSILAVLSTAYVVNEDFSMRTVQNVLSVGVSVGKYYFSRLFSQMLFVSALFLLSTAAYGAAGTAARGGVGTAAPVGETAAVILVMLLQLMAYVSFANMVGVFCRHQSAAMVAGETWLFLAIIFEGYREMGVRFFGFMAYEPLIVMQSVEKWGLPGAVSVPGVLRYVVSAAVIIAVTSGVGYVRFVRADIR